MANQSVQYDTSQVDVGSWATFFAARLYTLILPSTVALALYFYSSVNSKHKNLGYSYAGSSAWWEPVAWTRLRFVWGAQKILRDAYYKFVDKAFWIRRNDADILVLPAKYVNEIRHYSRDQLSGIEALAWNVLGPHLGVDILVRSDLHVRVLRNYLTPNMGKVMMNANDEIKYSWATDVPDCEEWTEVDIMQVMRWIVARISARTFIGYPACRDDKWVQTSLDYTRDVFGLTFMMHWFPEWMHPLLLPLTPARWRLDKAAEYANKVLKPAVERYDNAVAIGAQDEEPFTLLSGMLKDAKGSERDMREIIVRQLLSSLASIHTSTMAAVFCLMELCRHPEYIEPLTQEARETLTQETDWARHSTTRLPMMDSFIMEVIRLHPPSTLIPQRKAREAFTLSNGIHVPVGTHFGFPLGPVTHDPERYPNPEQFDAFRNYRKRKAEGLIGASSKYMATTPTEDHLVFGHGAQACPGRFFAVNEIKLILLFFLLDFDFKQPESQKSSRLHFPYEEYLVLNPMLKLMMKKKADSVFK